MLLEHLSQRLQDSALLPELRSVLSCLVAYDNNHPADAAWNRVIPRLQQLLGDTACCTEPFTMAWSLMYAAISRLDQLQDNDPVSDPSHDPLLTVSQPAAQYQVVFSYYILGEAILDLLSPENIPAHRILGVRRLWTDAMLRMSSGQYRDLLTQNVTGFVMPLETYQSLAQAKTGAAFALVFGGIAMLLTDELALIDILTFVGEIYGLLLQCSDDIIDEIIQPNVTLTLPTALANVHQDNVSDVSVHTSRAFWPYLYRLYQDQVQHALVDLPDDLRCGILDLFNAAFGRGKRSDGDEV